MEDAASPAGPKVALSNLPDRNQFFIGRKEVLAKIQEALATQRRVALSGLGGVGKTQTAVEYAHRHLSEYKYAFFITADSGETLTSGYVAIAGILKLLGSDSRDQIHPVEAVMSWFTLHLSFVRHPQSNTIEALKDWLTSHDGWLLILDNVDNLDMVPEFVPMGSKGHLLLTTQATAIGPIAQPVDIKKMGRDEGAFFLLRRANYIVDDKSLEAADHDVQVQAKEIAAQLDGLPLALDQAGAYLDKTRCGLYGYLRRYQNHAPELVQQSVAATTWALSFEKIEQANRAAAELLKFCAFLHPDGIPEELFSIGASELGSKLERVGSDAFEFDKTVSELLAYSLIRRDPKSGTLEIHRLVQEVLKQGMEEGKQRLWAERAVRVVNQVFPSLEFSTWALCERLLAQAHACAELIKQWDFEFPEAALLLNKAGYYVNERGRYSEVEPLYQRALGIREKALGEHPDVATSLNNLAELYHRQGEYGKVEPLFERALAIWEKASGPIAPDLARSLQGLAVLNRRQGRNRDAEPLLKRALEICEGSLGPKHADVGWKLEYLAELCRDQDRYDPAESLFERALMIREKALGLMHPEVARSLQGLAELYRRQSQHGDAEPLFKRALTIREQALGPEHPEGGQEPQRLGAPLSTHSQNLAN